jgi:hypothetical protein
MFGPATWQTINMDVPDVQYVCQPSIYKMCFKKKVIHCWCSVRGVGLHACCLACIPNLRHGALKHVAGRDNNQKTHVVRVPNSSLLTCHLRFRESHRSGKEYILYFCTFHTKTVICSTPPRLLQDVCIICTVHEY